LAQPLIAALKDRKEDVRAQASEALDGLGWQPDMGEAGAAYWIGKRQWDECVEIGTPAVEPLIAVLVHSDWEVRRSAAEALGKISDPRAVEPLIAALKDRKEDVCKIAGKALVEIGTPAVEPLITALEDNDKDVRKAVARALIEMYLSGKLDDEHKRSILTESDTITHPHIDRMVGESRWICNFQDGHEDRRTHDDYGIGVEFPL
jgi:HEAT repeat protein